MATYKVIQDIEAEDKLLGPFSLKQFIFGAIAIGVGFVMFMIVASSAPIFIKLPLVSLMSPMLLLFGVLAAPIGRDQPTDVWLLARLRFLFRPRVRIWNQDGMKELVTITAPKKEVHVYTDGLTHTEVKSRLGALASTLDSRGWAIKNINANLSSMPGYLTGQTDSDRLVDASQLPQEVSTIEVLASDDMLDPANNPTAERMNSLVQQASAEIKQQARELMTGNATPAQPATATQDYWFMNQTQPPAGAPQDYAVFSNQQVVTPGATTSATSQVTEEEKALIAKAAAKSEETAHLNDRIKTLQPLHDRDGNVIHQAPVEAAKIDVPPIPAPTAPPQPSPKAQALAKDNDKNLSTLSRMAQDDEEVVISLH